MAPLISSSDDDSSEKKQTTQIYLLDGSFKEITYDRATTVADAIKDIAQKIGLLSYSSFGLFECSRAPLGKMDKYFGLDDNKFIQYILEEFDSKDQKCKLYLKRIFFCETDEEITEDVFQKLVYVQFRHDFLEGHYPFAQEEVDDLAILSALLLFAEVGFVDPELHSDWNHSYAEKHWPKFLHRGKDRKHKILLTEKIRKRYCSMKVNMEKEEANRMFVSMLRKLRYGNSVFFTVKKIVDPLKCLKGNIIVLAINSVGVHFIRKDPSECLYSAEMKTIKQFRCSSTNLSFDIRVEDAVHEFLFETKQAEEICLALDAHRRVLIERRGTEASSADSDVSQPPDVSVCDSNQDIPNARKKNINQDGVEKEADKVKELTCEVDACKDVIATLTAEIDEWMKKTSALEVNCSSQEAKIYDLEQQLAAATQEKQKDIGVEKEADKVKELTCEVDAYKDVIATLTAEIDEWMKKTSGLEVNCSSQEGKIYDLEQQLAAATQEKQKVALRMAERLKKVGEDFEAIQADIHSCEITTPGLKEYQLSVKKENVRLKQQIDKTEEIIRNRLVELGREEELRVFDSRRCDREEEEEGIVEEIAALAKDPLIRLLTSCLKKQIVMYKHAREHCDILKAQQEEILKLAEENKVLQKELDEKTLTRVNLLKEYLLN